MQLRSLSVQDRVTKFPKILLFVSMMEQPETLLEPATARAGLLQETAKNSSWTVTGYRSRGHLKDLKDSKLIIDESKLFPWSSRISSVPFRTFRGSLFPKPVTDQELFLVVSYSKLALVWPKFWLEELSLKALMFFGLFNFSSQNSSRKADSIRIQQGILVRVCLSDSFY